MTPTTRYRLQTPGGTYAADTLASLALRVLRHRLRRWLRGDGWTD
jgi:hypothetical protein